MNITSISKQGTLKLPEPAHRHLKGAEYIQVRMTSKGITLTPIHISGLGNLRDIPKTIESPSPEDHQHSDSIM